MLKRIKKIVKRIIVKEYNSKHHTKIESLDASLSAVYGKGVHIAENVIITENVSIGQYSYVNRNSSVECCKIGNYCSISSGVYICPYEHNYKIKTTHPFAYLENEEEREKVEIGHDVLISLNVIILKGVKIGNGAVIGAGAVVTKDVMPYEIVGGVPARHIGWRFSEEEIDVLQKSHWWNEDIEVLKKNKIYFQNR